MSPRNADFDVTQLEPVFDFSEGAMSTREKARWLSHMRETTAHADAIDGALVTQMAKHHVRLERARIAQKELGELLDKLTVPPWYPALYLQTITSPQGPRALVQHGNAQRLVGAGPEVSLDTLEIGRRVFLNNELNLLMGSVPEVITHRGDTAAYERALPDGRLCLSVRDEHIMAVPIPTLDIDALTPGDLVTYDRESGLVFERIPQAASHPYMLDDLPEVGRDQVGGQDTNLEELLSALTTILVAPDRAAAYGLSGSNSVLMVGPPGCGKTLMARVCAGEVQRLSGRDCKFAVVKPTAWESPFVGETQKNIREFFEAVQRAADEAMVVVFLDEVESMGRIRGNHNSHHSDKFTASLLAELQGFSERKNVAIIGATNRKDLMDSALYERLSDVEVQVSRPDMSGARAIFDVHMSPGFPYSPNGASADTTRGEIVETAVTRIYAPNADNELCKVKFRDGKERTIAARELSSGRLFEQIARGARRKAFLREVRDAGDVGVQVHDMHAAVDDALEKLRSTLTIHNAHSYINDLPQDMDVVSVEPIVRNVRRSHRFVNIA